MFTFNSCSALLRSGCLLGLLLPLGAAAHPKVLTIPNPTLNPGTVGLAYQTTLGAAGGAAPYSWSASAGSPPGLSFAAGTMSGVPTAAGEFRFTVTVQDSVGAVATTSEDMWIGGAGPTNPAAGPSGETGTGNGPSSGPATGSNPSALAIAIGTLDPLTVGTAYTRNLMGSGGVPPYTWTVSAGQPPPGMALNGGIYAGTPTATPTGNYPFAVTLTDSAGNRVTVNYLEWVNGTAVASGGSPSGTGGNPPPMGNFTLTLVNGSLDGGGASATEVAGSTVTITAAAPPTGLYFQGWTGAPVTNPSAPTTTLTMPAANTTVTASYNSPPPVPFPVSGHPRLWITPSDLPHLQAWATPANPTYAALSTVLNQAIANYGTAFPGAALGALNPTPASPYPDAGDPNGYTGLLSEENAVILAFNSLIDPNPTNRANYAQAARNLLMYAMNQAAQGPGTGRPFRDPSFPLSNRSGFTGHDWPLIVDWIYPTLSAADRAVVRQVFLAWAGECLGASITGGDNPGPPGLVNSLALLPNGRPYRMASNNYFLSHARLLTMMSLALDPADDPPVNPQVAPAQIGNSLRSYIQDATGAWLYEEFAMMGDPAAVGAAYALPGNPGGTGFGLASGGLPPEGMLYGESFGYLLGQLLALQTAGFNSAALSGPQIGLIGAPVWDRYVTGYLSSLTPTPKVFPSESYLGSVYQVAGYGDLLRLWETPDHMTPFALLGLLDQETGTNAHVNAARWFARNVMPNGAAGLSARMANPWTWGVTQDLLYYLLLDPAAPPAADPRPGFPTLFYDAPAGRIVAHSDWSAAATVFDYRASWISINHQDGSSGLFELFRNGEWLTKEMSNYDGGGISNGATSEFHNSLALQNWTAAAVDWQGVDLPTWANGSQWMGNGNAGDPTTLASAGPGYVYAASDLTHLYNRRGPTTGSDAVSDITQATRSILWLNRDYIVVYDRATSAHPGLFKRFNLSLVANPAIAGSTATETLASGQQLFIQTLLPLGASASSFNGAALLNPVADLEPTQYVYQVQDPANPPDVRFLHVLQGADPGAAMAVATYRQSTGGTPFDGADFGGNEVWFPTNGDGAFAGTVLSCAAGTQSVYVAGLSPDGSYSVTVTPQGASIVVTISAGGASAADAAGLLQISVGAAP